MNPIPRRRLWIEMALALAGAALAVMTLFSRDWVEALLPADPDRHDGSLEWLLVVGLGTLALVLGALARAEWRRVRATEAE
jgi:hypothetical protein